MLITISTWSLSQLGGNPVFNVDPKVFNPADTSLRLENQGKDAGGDNHNNTSNMSSQHVTFMLKYEPTTGDVLKKQVWVARLSGSGGNTVNPRDIAVNEDGIISFTGRSSAYFPDRLSQTQTLNGEVVPSYENSGTSGDGFYLELLPDMRTRIRSTIFKKTNESEVNSVASRGTKRAAGGKIIGGANSEIMTKNPIQLANAGGNNEGIIAAWGFQELQKDYAISTTRTPTSGTIALGQSFSTNIALSYTGSIPLDDSAALEIAIPLGINYTNELYDGFACQTVSGNKTCTKNITVAQWTNGYNQTLDLRVPPVLEGSQSDFNRNITFKIIPANSLPGDADANPINNISAQNIVIDATVPAEADYRIDPTLASPGNIALGGYAEIDVAYFYLGPATPQAMDKKLVVTIPDGLEYDRLNRSGLQCTTTANVQTCSRNLLQTNFRYGSSFKYFLRAKNPASGVNPKTVNMELSNNNGDSVDNNPNNHTNKTIIINVDSASVSNLNYGIEFGTVPTYDVSLGQAISVPINLKFVSNTPLPPTNSTLLFPKV